MKRSLGIILIPVFILLSACSREEPLQWVPGWKATSSLNEARGGAAYVEANGYIYILGGLDGKMFMNTTEYAKIGPDGSLGPWKYGPKLNIERSYMEAAVHNGYIYVVGGANATDLGDAYASGLLASVERARIQPDGSLSEWVLEETSMRIPRRCNKVVVWNDHIYAAGGYAGVMLDSVERAKINKDGSVGEWIVEPEKLLVPRYVNGVKAKKGALYVFGGHAQKNGVGMTSVEMSTVSETGELAPWKYTSPLQSGRHGHATTSHGKDFYVLGGYTGTSFIDSVEKSSIKADGELSPWQYTTELTTERINYSVIVYKDWVYAISGTNGSGYLKGVEFASFNDKGDIGFMGTAVEKEAHEKKVAAKKAAKKLATEEELNFKGVVKNILRTEGYIYIEVFFMNENVWLAVSDPKLKIDVNDEVLFGKGLFMPNFYSKQLERKFKKLFFMDKVRKFK